MSSQVIISIPKLSSNGVVFKDYVECKVESSIKGRKRRLDHLSWEEKLQRKKLKNRVAAQTSRDRKKQKMEEMEITLQELMDKNQRLFDECEKLKEMNEKLLKQNEKMQTQCCCAQNRCEPSVGPVATKRPAESTLQPQGVTTDPAVAFSRCQRQQRYQTTALVLRLLLTCLMTQKTQNSQNLEGLKTSHLLKTLQTWKASQRTFLKNSLKNCKSPPIKTHSFHRLICRKIDEDRWWTNHQKTWNSLSIP